MSIRTVPASRGIEWIVKAIQLILANPAPFALMGLIMAVIGVVPVLGSLALAILGPALYGGIVWAARAQRQGETARFEQLFQAFHEDGKLGPMLLLCLPGVIGGVVAALIIVIALVVVAAGAGVSAAADSSLALWTSLGLGGVFLLVVVLAMAVVMFSLTFFAIPDVMLARNDGFEAMKQSARASRINIGALLLYLLVIVLAMFVVAAVLGLVSSLLAQFVVAVVAAPVVGVSMYLAWRDVYGDVTQELPMIPEPPDGGGMVA